MECLRHIDLHELQYKCTEKAFAIVKAFMVKMSIDNLFHPFLCDLFRIAYSLSVYRHFH